MRRRSMPPPPEGENRRRPPHEMPQRRRRHRPLVWVLALIGLAALAVVLGRYVVVPLLVWLNGGGT